MSIAQEQVVLDPGKAVCSRVARSSEFEVWSLELEIDERRSA
jgi:hypothetical protein